MFLLKFIESQFFSLIKGLNTTARRLEQLSEVLLRCILVFLQRI